MVSGKNTNTSHATATQHLKYFSGYIYSSTLCGSVQHFTAVIVKHLEMNKHIMCLCLISYNDVMDANDTCCV